MSQGPLLSVYNTTDEASRLVFSKLTHTATMGQESSFLCGEGEGEEGGTVAGGGGVGASAGGSRWSVMSSSASGEVLVAEASRCSAVSEVVCVCI